MNRWRKPRKPFLARLDVGYYKRPEGATGPGLVLRSGPFKDRRFRTRSKAEAWLGDQPAPTSSIHELRWVPVEGAILSEKERDIAARTLGEQISRLHSLGLRHEADEISELYKDLRHPDRTKAQA